METKTKWRLARYAAIALTFLTLLALTATVLFIAVGNISLAHGLVLIFTHLLSIFAQIWVINVSNRYV